MPRFEAAILSRMRSPVTSRSNWAKESSMLRVRRSNLYTTTVSILPARMSARSCPSAACFSIEILWSADMPHQPDATAGRTIEVIVNHGDHVFVSEKELARKSILDSVLVPLSLAAFFGFAALNWKYRPFSKSPGRDTARRP
jgi:hypothetical protein